MTQNELKLVFDALKQCNIFAYAGGLGVRATAHTNALAILEKALAQRTWVKLEGEEIRNSWEEATKPDRSTMTIVTSFARAIEAKLKEKNT